MSDKPTDEFSSDNQPLNALPVEEAVQRPGSRIRTIMDASPLGIVVSNAQSRCIYSNPAYQAISGQTHEQALGSRWSSAVHPDDRERVLNEWRMAAQDGSVFRSEVRLLRWDDRAVWARINAVGMFDNGLSQGHVHLVEDISERKSMELLLQMAEEALFREKERTHVTLNAISDAVLAADTEGNVTYLNQAAEAITGWFRSEAIGQPLSVVFRLIDDATGDAANPAQRAMDEDRRVGLMSDYVLIRHDGTELAIENTAAPLHHLDGSVAGAAIIFHDVTESKAMVLEMSHLAQHDVLTGLPNRVLLAERFSQAIGRARRRHLQVALLFVDLDFFKQINDSRGHKVGDQVLQVVADRLIAYVRTTDTVCRLGGDEFVILLAEIDDPQVAAHIAEKLLAAFTMPQTIDGSDIQIALSIGISVYPEDGMNADVIMQNADTAMYYAKTRGRNCYRFFRADMNARAIERRSVENGLHRALSQDEFLLHYQPQFDLATGALIGVEALVRWRRPDDELIYPEQFVSVAEECGLIVEIGQWIVRAACWQMRAWLDAGLEAVAVSVNISPVEFKHSQFLENISLALKDAGLAPRHLKLELTESLLMEDPEGSESILEALRGMGVRLVIDGFGTGYSSLSNLKRLPIEALKIDQSLIRGVTNDLEEAAIVRAMIGMGQNLNRKVIAQGVETESQLAFLRAQHCDAGQGYYFIHPLSAANISKLLLARNDDSRQ